MNTYDIEIALRIIDNSDYPIELSGTNEVHRIIQDEENKVGNYIAEQISGILYCDAEFKQFYETYDNKILITISQCRYNYEQILYELSRYKLDYHSNFNAIIYTEDKFGTETAVNAVFDIQWVTTAIGKQNALESNSCADYGDCMFWGEGESVYPCPICNKISLTSTSFSVPKDNDICICHFCCNTFLAKAQDNGTISFKSCSEDNK